LALPSGVDLGFMTLIETRREQSARQLLIILAESAQIQLLYWRGRPGASWLNCGRQRLRLRDDQGSNPISLSPAIESSGVHAEDSGGLVEALGARQDPPNVQLFELPYGDGVAELRP
jgi:hypothetical protein